MVLNLEEILFSFSAHVKYICWLLNERCRKINQICFVVFRFSAKNLVILLLVKHEKDERDSNFILHSFGHSFIYQCS